MNSPPPLPETARLRLRPFSVDDLDLLDRLNGDPKVMQHLGGVMPHAQTETMLRERILDYAARNPGLGAWATIERASGACIGFHLLNHIQGETDIQVGYRLFPQYWGMGYATEMSIGLLRYGYTDLGLDRIVAITAPENLASQKVLRKAGLLRRGERHFRHPAYAAWGALPYFERRATDWLRLF